MKYLAKNRHAKPFADESLRKKSNFIPQVTDLSTLKRSRLSHPQPRRYTGPTAQHKLIAPLTLSFQAANKSIYSRQSRSAAITVGDRVRMKQIFVARFLLCSPTFITTC